jgi:hypothetical protein
MRLFPASLVLIALLISASSPGQETASPAISTERPTAGYSPDVIPAGSLQVESGVGMNAQLRQFSGDLPQSLVRLGFHDRFELRVQPSEATYVSHAPAGVSRLQSTDLGFSGKFLIGLPNSLLPRSGILGFSAPTGGVSQTSGSYDPNATLIWTQSVRHGVSFNEVGIATLTTLNGARRPVWAPSVLAGKSAGEKLSLFAELAPTMLQERSMTWLVDGGFAYLPTRNRQIDLRVGYLSDGTGSHCTISAGLSQRRENFLSIFLPQPMGK